MAYSTPLNWRNGRWNAYNAPRTVRPHPNRRNTLPKAIRALCYENIIWGARRRGAQILRNTERNAMAVSRRFLEERHDDAKLTDIPSRGRVAALHLKSSWIARLVDRFGNRPRNSSVSGFVQVMAPAGEPSMVQVTRTRPCASRSRLGDLEPQSKFRQGAVRRRHHFQGESLRGPSPSIVFRRMPAVQCTDEQAGMPGPALEQNKHPFIGLGVDGVGVQSLVRSARDQTPSIPPGIKAGAIQPGRISSNSSDRCWPPWASSR